MIKKLTSSWRKNALLRLLNWKSKDRYRPEKYYMRGPGPKAQSKGAGTNCGCVPANAPRPDKRR
jgi:hypothetical protein